MGHFFVQNHDFSKYSSKTQDLCQKFKDLANKALEATSLLAYKTQSIKKPVLTGPILIQIMDLFDLISF